LVISSKTASQFGFIPSSWMLLMPGFTLFPGDFHMIIVKEAIAIVAVKEMALLSMVM